MHGLSIAPSEHIRPLAKYTDGLARWQCIIHVQEHAMADAYKMQLAHTHGKVCSCALVHVQAANVLHPASSCTNPGPDFLHLALVVASYHIDTELVLSSP